MRKNIFSAAITASIIMMSAPAVHADYYQYNDELRKPGQTVEEAKQEQMESYRDAMNEKYKSIEKRPPASHKDAYATSQKSADQGKKADYMRQMREARAAEVEDQLGLTDDQKSSFKELREEAYEFMENKKKEVIEFEENQYQAFKDILTEEQIQKLEPSK